MERRKPPPASRSQAQSICKRMSGKQEFKTMPPASALDWMPASKRDLLSLIPSFPLQSGEAGNNPPIVQVKKSTRRESKKLWSWNSNLGTSLSMDVLK